MKLTPDELAERMVREIVALLLARTSKFITCPLQTRIRPGLTTLRDLTYQVLAQNPDLVGTDRAVWTEEEGGFYCRRSSRITRELPRSRRIRDRRRLGYRLKPRGPGKSPVSLSKFRSQFSEFRACDFCTPATLFYIISGITGRDLSWKGPLKLLCVEDCTILYLAHAVNNIVPNTFDI